MSTVNEPTGSSTNIAQMNSWYFEPKQFSDYLHLKGTPVPDDRIFPVSADSEAEAERLLEEQAIVQLQTDTAKEMVGVEFKPAEGLKPFLVRALVYSKVSGKWGIYEHDCQLQVAHNSLGGGPAQMHRQALVLLLRSKPSVVYTFCSTVQ
jgi:hypothetical protein